MVKLMVSCKGAIVLLVAVASFSLSCGGRISRVAPVYNAQSTFDAEAKRVVVVSFDGLRPDAIERADTPHLHSMRVAGTYTDTAQAVYPSITLVNHASMISGVAPAKHGIYWNSYEPSQGMIRVPTMFDLAKQKALKTVMVAGKEKFEHFRRDGTIDEYVLEEGSPADIAKKAVTVLKTNRPQLMFVHLRFPDSEGHSKGWMSSDQLAAIEDSDQVLGHILVALKELEMLKDTAVIVTADHGGSSKGHGSEASIDMTIPWIATGAEIPVRGPLTTKVTTYDTAATVADLLELDVPADFDGKSVFSAPSTAP